MHFVYNNLYIPCSKFTNMVMKSGRKDAAGLVVDEVSC